MTTIKQAIKKLEEKVAFYDKKAREFSIDTPVYSLRDMNNQLANAYGYSIRILLGND